MNATQDTRVKLTRAEAAEALGVSVRTVDRLLKGGRLPYTRDPVTGRIAIPERYVHARRAAQTVPAQRTPDPSERGS